MIAAAASITPIVTPRIDWAAAAPLLILTGAALLLLLVSSLTTAKPGRGTFAIVTVLACAFFTSFSACVKLWYERVTPISKSLSMVKCVFSPKKVARTAAAAPLTVE